jgi:hypothetical protein
MTEHQATARLLAVLCNPSTKPTELTTSWRNVRSLAAQLGSEEPTIENLIEVPTRTTVELASAQWIIDEAALAARLEAASRRADLVVAGWGSGRPASVSSASWRAVVGAAVRGLAAGGHTGVWHVGPGMRHPSRWRQHTSPVHDRYAGATFEDRLLTALRWTPIEEIGC